MLNRPSSLRVSDLLVSEDLVQCFGNQRLRLGGSNGQSSLYVLHGESRARGSSLICPGLYSGGLASSMRMIQSDLAEPGGFALFSGYAAWRPGELEQDIARGRWAVVSAAPSVVLELACAAQHAGAAAWHTLAARLDVRGGPSL